MRPGDIVEIALLPATKVNDLILRGKVPSGRQPAEQPSRRDRVGRLVRRQRRQRPAHRHASGSRRNIPISHGAFWPGRAGPCCCQPSLALLLPLVRGYRRIVRSNRHFVHLPLSSLGSLGSRLYSRRILARSLGSAMKNRVQPVLVGNARGPSALLSCPPPRRQRRRQTRWRSGVVVAKDAREKCRSRVRFRILMENRLDLNAGRPSVGWEKGAISEEMVIRYRNPRAELQWLSLATPPRKKRLSSPGIPRPP